MNKIFFLILISLVLNTFAQLPSPGPRCFKDGGASCDYTTVATPYNYNGGNGDNGNNGNAPIPPPTTLPAAPPPPSSDNSGRCTIIFYANGNVVYTRNVNTRRAQDAKPALSRQANNNIDMIQYYGECYCWINLFSGMNYQLDSIGFWVNPEGDGAIYLTDYQSFDQDNEVWNQWDRVASSYWINCYF